MNKTILSVLAILIIGIALFYTLKPSGSNELIIYSGRSKALVDPIIERFQAETGITVQVKYGGTTQLAVALIEEGDRSPADLFWAQDGGALGAVNKAGLLKQLPSNLTNNLPNEFKNSQGRWVATTGRARVLAYSPSRVDPDDLPQSVFDLTDAKWNSRIAWAPTNASFQSFVSAMQLVNGDEATREWLLAMMNNGVKNYANNNAILQGIAAGEADLGITNHYYLFRAKAENPAYPVEQTHFAAGDVGNMVNVAGIGQLASSDNSAALDFIEYLLKEETQRWFATDVYEYPVIDIGEADFAVDGLLTNAPVIDLEELDDLERTLNLLREIGLL